MTAVIIPDLAQSAEKSLQAQIQDLQEEIRYIKTNYEKTEPVEVIKPVTEWVSPSGEIFREPQKDGVSPTDGSKLSERTTFRKLKFSRRESVGEKIDAAVSSAINGHVVVGLELVGAYVNTVGAGDSVDATGTTRNANRGEGTGAVDVTLAGKPMRNTLLFVDLDAADGRAKLSEAWLAINDPGRVYSLQVGIIDLSNAIDTNMVANDENAQFITADFVNSPLLANPENALGAILRADYGRYEAVLAAQNSQGLTKDVTDDVYWAGELGLRYHLLGDLHARVWGRQQPRGSQQPDQALGVSVDHRLSSRTTLFGRFGKSSYVETLDQVTGERSALNSLDWAASGGMEFTNFNPRLLKERVGLAYGCKAQQDGGSEQSIEVYNRIPLTPNFALGLHYQASFSRVQAGLRDTSTGNLLGQDARPALHHVGLRVQATY